MHKHYLGIASIIFATACLIWSIGQATAIPMGPSVNTGSIPYESFSSSISNGAVQPCSLSLRTKFLLSQPVLIIEELFRLRRTALVF